MLNKIALPFWTEPCPSHKKTGTNPGPANNHINT